MSETGIKKQVLNPEQIRKVFLSYEERVKKYEKQLLAIEINDDITENSALLMYGQGKELVDSLKEVEKTFVEPYSDAVNGIRSYFKKFIEPLTKGVEIAGNKILTWKEQKAELLKQQEADKMKNLNDEFDINYEKFELLKRIANNSTCRIFGGVGIIKGKETIFEAATTIEACESLKHSFENSFPDANNFGNFGPNSIMIKEFCLQKLNEVITMIKNGKEIDNQFHRNLLSNKIEMELITEEKRLMKQKQVEEKNIIKVTASAFSNTRKTIKFEIMDISQIPINYLIVDKMSVDNFVAMHRDEIKQKLKDNDTYEGIKGIKFYFEKKVTR